MSRRETSLSRSYFATLAVVAIVPLLIGVSVEVWSNYQRQLASDEALRQVEAANAAARVETYFTTLATFLSSIQSADGGVALDVRARADEYRRAFAVFNQLVSLAWVNENRIEVIRLDRRAIDELDGRAPSRESVLVQKAIESGALEFATAQDRRRAVLHVASAGKRASDGVLVLTFDLRFLSDLLATLTIPGDGSIFVTDAQGKIIAHDNVNLALRGVAFPEASLELGTALAPTDVPSDQHISRILFSSKRIASPDWRVIVTQPEAKRRHWIVEALVRFAVLALVSLFVVGGVAFWRTRSMVRPIESLSQQMAALPPGSTFADSDEIKFAEIKGLATQFSKMSERLAEAHTSLERRVAEKTRDLADANASLEQASRHKSDFLAHMSHELRTPLNAVIGFSDMLKAQYFGTLNEKQMEYVNDINASGQHLLLLINDILDLAKIEAGRLDLQLGEFSVSDSLEQCRVFVAPRVAEKSQSLTVDIDPRIGTWVADERKFRQCVINLLANASKFTDRGGAIRLRCVAEGDELVVSVIDNGVGIASDQLDRLFQDFYQVGNGSSPNVANAVEGTGLGLALTKRLVELHGGQVSVDSELGRGSIFTLRFPAQVRT